MFCGQDGNIEVGAFSIKCWMLVDFDNIQDLGIRFIRAAVESIVTNTNLKPVIDLNILSI